MPTEISIGEIWQKLNLHRPPVWLRLGQNSRGGYVCTLARAVNGFEYKVHLNGNLDRMLPKEGQELASVWSELKFFLEPMTKQQFLALLFN